MKNTLLTLLLVVIVFSAYSQSISRVVLVLNHARWCPACKKNEERISADVISKVKKEEVTVFDNDMSDNASKAKSSYLIQKAGYWDAVSSATASGQILLIDANTKKLIGKISVTKSSDEINKFIRETVHGI